MEQLGLDLGLEPPEPQPATPPPVEAEQLELVTAPGCRRTGALPSRIWQAILAHEPTRERYRAKVCVRSPDVCWYWTGAISNTGHGKLRAGPEGIVVTAHVFGWQLHHGVIKARSGQDLVIAHKCDEASCQNPAHWELVERAVNGADYQARRWRASAPLADVRGAAGRATAIRDAIRQAAKTGADLDQAIAAAAAAGLRSVPGLF